MTVSASLAATLPILLLLAGGAGYFALLPTSKNADFSVKNIGGMFACGIVVWSACATIGYLFSLKLSEILIIYALASLSLFLAAFRFNRKIALSPPNLSSIVLFFAAFLVFLFLILVGAHDNYSSDASIHLAYIQRALRLPEISLDLFQLTPTVKSPLLSGAYAYNVIHLLYAASAVISGFDPTQTWIFTAAYVSIVFIFTMVFAGTQVANHRNVSALIPLALLIYWGWVDNPTRTFSYPAIFGQILYIAYAGFLAHYTRCAERSSALEITLAAISGALLLTHPQWWLYAGITAICASAYAMLLTGARFTRCLYVVLLFIMGSAPIIIMKWGIYDQSRGLLPNFFDDRYANIIYSVWGMRSFNPISILNWYDWLFLFASVSVIAKILWRRVKKREVKFSGSGFAAAMLISFFVILLVPPLTSIAIHFVTANIVLRILTYAVPIWGVFLLSILVSTLFKKHWASVIERLGTKLSDFLVASTIVAAAICLPVSIFFLESSGFNYTKLRELDKRHESIYGPSIKTVNNSRLRGLLDAIPASATVLSDMSKLAPLYRGAQSVGPIKTHSGAELQLKKKIDRLFDAETDYETERLIMEELNPDFVLLSPINSNMSWMRNWDERPEFKLLSDVTDPSLGFGNNRYILYAYETGHITGNAAKKQNNEKIESPDCSSGSIKIPYEILTDMVPAGARRAASDLSVAFDGDDGETVTWMLRAHSWFFLGLKLPYDEYELAEVSLRMNNATSSYNSRLSDIAFFGKDVSGYWRLIEHIKPSGYREIGAQSWAVPICALDLTDIRIAFRAKARVSVAEVALLGKKLR